MGRLRNIRRYRQREKARRLYNAIEENPGLGKAKMQLVLGWTRGQVEATLIYMSDFGYVLSEDLDGGLWPYDRPGGM